ncbi:MAG TPA: deoxyribonuclease IV [Haloplasmataceae bacterium]
MLIIGSHVNMSGKEMFLGSVKEALTYDANALMIYTGAPQNTIRKAIDMLHIPEAHSLLLENNIPLDNIIVHAPYIINLANPDSEKHHFAIDFLTKEIMRTHALGAKQIVLHPGAHMGKGESEGIKRVSSGLNEVINNTIDLDVKIALETMAGKGSEVGKNFQELASIFQQVTHNERLSICFDTCHTHDYGYLVKDDFDFVMEEFDNTIGIKHISVFHINDSKNPIASRKDRHANIGFGYIGFEALNKIVHHQDLSHIPKILETPYIKTDNDDLVPPYKEEIDNFRKQTFNKQGILKYL